jgi:hypothetical protein
MAKASPSRHSFNAGEFSVLLEGRTDVERYNASMRRMMNVVAAPQGPAMRRSGTYMVSEARKNNQFSHAIPFIFSDEQSNIIEAAHLRFRLIFDSGVQVYDASVIAQVTALSPMKILSPALTAQITAKYGAGHGLGKQVALSGFAAERNLEGVIANVTAVAGNVYTLDVNYTGATGVAPAAATAALVYEIVTPFAHTDVRNIRAVQAIDVVYLFCDGYRPRKLSRHDTYDWRLETLEFDHGPFLQEVFKFGTLTPTSTGSPTKAGTPSAISEGTGGRTAAKAFNDDLDDYWTTAEGTTQEGWIQYDMGAGNAKVIKGYVIYAARENSSETFIWKDYAPGDFTFAGSNDGATFTTLDTQLDYTIYDTGRSAFFKLKNTTAYRYYRLTIKKLTRNGDIRPRIAKLSLFQEGKTIAFTLSGEYDDLNKGAGFLATDVGRLIRCKGTTDQNYRVLEIATRTDATHITATLMDEPFVGIDPIHNWAPGYWSDTTGWPTCGSFFEDRLWVSGATEYPDVVAGSRTGGYEDFTQKTPTDEVLDDHAVIVRINSKKLSSVRWLSSDERGLLIGTGTAEWVVQASDADNALSARNVRGRSSTERGSADIEPAKVDRQVLYVQASRRTVREYAYVFESDGYKSPSMSLFASHLGAAKFAQMVYQSEPHSIMWFRRDDGSVVGLTYNREENVIGWHQHDFAGGIVESMAVIPSATDNQDTLWLVVRRTINGQTKRYYERLMRFWDFDSVVTEAHFVDCGLRYDGTPTNVVRNLSHLEGCAVDGVADGVPFRGLVVLNGTLRLPRDVEASTIIIGLGYTSEAEISRIEAGGADGTSQGKVKRINSITAFLWDSAYGEIGVYDEDKDEIVYTDIEYNEPYDELEPVRLQTQMFGPTTMPSGNSKRGSIAFRQTMPLPFNVISLLPQLNTQDR